MKRTLLRNEGSVKGVHTLYQGTLRWHHDHPRAEGTWGGNDAAPVQESWAAVLEGLLGLSCVLKEKQLLRIWGGGRPGNVYVWICRWLWDRCALTSLTFILQFSCWWDGRDPGDGVHRVSPSGNRDKRTQGLDGGGEKRITSPVCTF